LQEAESALNVVEPELAALRRSVTSKRKHLHEERSKQLRELHEEEEASAAWKGRRNSISDIGHQSCAQLRDEEASLQERLRDAEARYTGVDEAVASELYWRWRGVFEAHLRAGGRFEDFSLDDFFHDQYKVASAEELKVPVEAAQRLRHEIADFTYKSSETFDAEDQLRSELGVLEVELKRLRHEVKEQESTNYVWWQGHLGDKPRLHELRGEQNRWHLEQTELQLEMNTFRDRQARVRDFICRQRAEAAELRAKVMPCEQLVSVMEQSFEINEEHGQRIKQTVEMKEYELNQHKLLREASHRPLHRRLVGRTAQHRGL